MGKTFQFFFRCDQSIQIRFAQGLSACNATDVSSEECVEFDEVGEV
jgi:hypothetical protein